MIDAGPVTLSHAIDTYTPGLVLSPEQAKAHVDLLKSIMKSVLVCGTDYGKIPGAKKPSLHKPGAERLLQVFGLAQRPTRLREVLDWDRDPPFIQYDYRTDVFKVITLPDGSQIERPIASREGTCNSMEDRYRWRWVNEHNVPAGLDQEGLERKQVRDRAGQWLPLFRVPNTDTATLANTIMQMAQKRSAVQATLAACGASGLFTDDNADDLAESGHLEGQSGDGRRGGGGRRQSRRTSAERPAATIEESARVGLIRSLGVQIKRLGLSHDHAGQLAASLFGGKSTVKELADSELHRLAEILAEVPTGTDDVLRQVLYGGEEA